MKSAETCMRVCLHRQQICDNQRSCIPNSAQAHPSLRHVPQISIRRHETPPLVNSLRLIDFIYEASLLTVPL